MKPNERLLSLDTLRGFDMLFIMGFAGDGFGKILDFTVAGLYK